MSASLTLERLTRAVREEAAVRRIRRLQPAGGPGDRIFPPTYPGARDNDPARHVFEHRRVAGANVLCVLIDSVQSQANRLEEALKAAREAKDAVFPAITVDFSRTELPDLGRIGTLDAPHRVFDAIIRDSQHEGQPFRETEHGRRLVEAKAQNARAVYELSPTALVFGAWNSTGEGGGLGAKFPRAVVSEIIGVGVATEIDAQTGRETPSGKRTGSRVDPLGIRSAVRVYKQPNGDWTLEPPKAATDAKNTKGKDKGAKEVKPVKPSEVNHSNIRPTVDMLGVSVDYAQHTFVLSLAALRRLRLGAASASPESDVHARTCLAALALFAATAQDRAGYALRSRCDLVPEVGSAADFEIVLANGATEAFGIDYARAADLLKAAVGAAPRDARWRDADLVLEPQRKLVELVRQSRERALVGDAEAAEG